VVPATLQFGAYGKVRAMMAGRRGFLAGLLVGVLPLTAAAATPELLVPVQYRDFERERGRGRPPRRRRRCWMQRQEVVVRDRYGRPRRRWVTREVCR
jgi:hypothetical protein